MNARFRFSAKACLLSVTTGLFAGQAAGLYAQTGYPTAQPIRSASTPSAPAPTGAAPRSVAPQPRQAVPQANHKITGGSAQPVGPATKRVAVPQAVPYGIQQVAARDRSADAPTGTVQQAKPQPATVEQHLQELYRRDGRQMPSMNLSEYQPPFTPSTQQAGATAAGPEVRQAAAQPKPSLLHRIFPWHKSSAPEHAAQPAVRPPQMVGRPAVNPQGPVTAQQQRPAVQPTAPAPVTTPAPVPEAVAAKAPAVAQQPARFKPADESTPLLLDETGADDTEDLQAMDDLRDNKDPAAAGDVAQAEESPFSGRTLEASEGGDTIAKMEGNDDEDLGLDEEDDEQSERDQQIRNLAERVGQKGFKGFCPVTLKNERRLLDAQPQYYSEYREKVYTFATPEAKAEFDEHPELYVAAGDGNDVVRQASGTEHVEGSLDHAVWYKGRLFLFTDSDSLDKFIAAPSKYVPKL